MTKAFKRALPALALALVLLQGGEAFAVTRRVPTDVGTIQQAINMSATGDTVRVARGVYREAVRFRSADVKLFSEYAYSSDSADLLETIIDASDWAAEDTASCICFFEHTTVAAEVCGFVLRGGSGSRLSPGYSQNGGGVYAYESSATVRSNIFTQNTGFFPALDMTGSAAVVVHNLFVNNDCASGSLLGFTDTMGPARRAIFEWNEIVQNEGLCAGIGWYGNTGSFSFNHFHDCEYESNRVVQFDNVYTNDIQMCGNIFENLVGGQSLWPMVETDATVRLIQDNIFRNCTTGANFAISLSRNNVRDRQEISRNLFQNMYEPAELTQASPGIYIQWPNVYIHDNVFDHCSGGTQGMIWSCEATAPGGYLRIERNRFIGNRCHTQGLGAAAVNLSRILPVSDSLPVMINNWFEDNGPVSVAQDDGPTAWNVPNNYWGDSTGPYHPIENPLGRGDTVDASLHVTPWLTHPPDLASGPERPEGTLQPSSWQLDPIFPNPFNSSVTIRLRASITETVKITIHDITGRQVREFWQGLVPKGITVDLHWNGDSERGSLASGVYFVRAVARNGSPSTQTQKAILLR